MSSWFLRTARCERTRNRGISKEDHFAVGHSLFDILRFNPVETDSSATEKATGRRPALDVRERILRC